MGVTNMKSHPFMLRVPANEFSKCEVGQILQIDNGPQRVTRVVSVKMIRGQMLEIIGLCKEAGGNG